MAQIWWLSYQGFAILVVIGIILGIAYVKLFKG